MLAALPKSVKRIAVMDRTKEHGSGGELGAGGLAGWLNWGWLCVWNCQSRLANVLASWACSPRRAADLLCPLPLPAAEPLLLDVATTLQRKRRHVDCIVGGRYGLASKDFTPAM